MSDLILPPSVLKLEWQLGENPTDVLRTLSLQNIIKKCISTEYTVDI